MSRLCLCKQRNIEKHYFQSEKSTSEIGVKLLVFFTFFITFFIKTLIKSIIYCQTVPVERLLAYVVKTVCQASLLLFLN